MHSRRPVIAAMHRLMAFAQWVRVRRMIAELALEPKQTFWNMTSNVLLDAAALEWAKVFGSPKTNDTHWMRALPAEEHDATRAALLAHLHLSATEWDEQRRSIVEYRNQLVAHHDLRAAVPNFPHYDVALQAAFFMFARIRAAADQDWLGGIPPDLDKWSKTVTVNMRAIVRKAHAASARLGSNVRG